VNHVKTTSGPPPRPLLPLGCQATPRRTPPPPGLGAKGPVLLYPNVLTSRRRGLRPILSLSRPPVCGGPADPPTPRPLTVFLSGSCRMFVRLWDIKPGPRGASAALGSPRPMRHSRPPGEIHSAAVYSTYHECSIRLWSHSTCCQATDLFTVNLFSKDGVTSPSSCNRKEASVLCSLFYIAQNHRPTRSTARPPEPQVHGRTSRPRPVSGHSSPAACLVSRAKEDEDNASCCSSEDHRPP